MRPRPSPWALRPRWSTQLVGYEALLILADGTMLSTRRFPFGTVD